MKVSVIGTGYVGLVTGACLAERGHEVICVDRDAAKVEAINRGEAPIFEPGLDALLARNVGGRLCATTDLDSAVHETDLSLIAVGTPYRDSEIDLGQVETVTAEIGAALRTKRDYHVVVVKSTVVPGTTDALVGPLLEGTAERQSGRDFGLGMNPEFLREGAAVEDFMQPDRIVLGGIDERTLEAMARLYAPFTGVDIIRTDNRTAEMIKYAANSLFATLISFSNEIGNLCAATGGIDVVDVMRGVHLDRRLSPILEGERLTPGLMTYLEAGCGFGGSCFPKDLRALAAYGRQIGASTELLEAVVRINDRQPEQVIRLLKRHFDRLDGVSVTVLGLSFKPGTDDMRESPALPVIRSLGAEGAVLRAYDPAVGPGAVAAVAALDGTTVEICDTLTEAIEEAEAIALITGWPEFTKLPELLAGRDPQPVVIDGRRMLDKDRFERYEGIGL